MSAYTKIKILGKKSKGFRKYCENYKSNEYVILKSRTEGSPRYSVISLKQNFTDVTIGILDDIRDYSINNKTIIDYKELKHKEKILLERLLDLGKEREQSKEKIKNIERILYGK